MRMKEGNRAYGRAPAWHSIFVGFPPKASRLCLVVRLAQRLQSRMSARRASSVSDRLYGDAARRRQKREADQKAQRDAELASYPFRPQINPTSDVLVGSPEVPISQRSLDTTRKLMEKQRQWQEEQENQHSFKPAILDRSRELAARSRVAQVPIAERSQDTSRKLMEKQRRWQEEQESQHSFKPAILDRSRALAAKSGAAALPITERAREIARKRLEKQRKLEEETMAECTFKPQTYNADEYLFHHRPSMLGETTDARDRRLSCADADRISRTREAIREEHYGKFTYRPVINDSSRVRVH